MMSGALCLHPNVMARSAVIGKSDATQLQENSKAKESK
jgi:hypothetical protein